MLHLERKGRRACPLSSEEALERLLSASLRRRLGQASPPDDMWTRIAARVDNVSVASRASHTPVRSSSKLALAVQATMITSLLLVVGLVEDRGADTLGSGYYSANPTPISRQAAMLNDSPEGAPHSYVFVRHDSNVPSRLGGLCP